MIRCLPAESPGYFFLKMSDVMILTIIFIEIGSVVHIGIKK